MNIATGDTVSIVHSDHPRNGQTGVAIRYANFHESWSVGFGDGSIWWFATDNLQRKPHIDDNQKLYPNLGELRGVPQVDLSSMLIPVETQPNAIVERPAKWPMPWWKTGLCFLAGACVPYVVEQLAKIF